MGKIIAAIDGSGYADHVCALSAWAYQQTGDQISLLHVVPPHQQGEAKTDMTGQIGLGAKTSLLAELTKLDEEHGKLAQRKGQLILDHAKQILADKGIDTPEILHRRGALVEMIDDLQAEAALVIMGKRGEHHHGAVDHIASNLERVARAIHKPLLVATPLDRPIAKFLLAYDGSASADKAVSYIEANPLLKGLACHLLQAGPLSEAAKAKLDAAKAKLTKAGLAVTANNQDSTNQLNGTVEDIVTAYASAHKIDLLAIGAYGHSKIRSLILGSTTTALIRKSNIPVLLFR